jgi:hypothetical protein
MSKNIWGQRFKIHIPFIFLQLVSNLKNSEEEESMQITGKPRVEAQMQLTDCYFSKPRKIDQCQVHNCQNPKES